MPTNIEALTDNYGVEDGDNAWSNNLLARDTVVLPNGTLARRSSAAPARTTGVDALRVLTDLAKEAELVAAGLSVGMGSEGSEGFEAFACHLGTQVGTVDERAVRAIFGDALYERATITIESLDEGTEFWRRIEEDCVGSDALLGRFRDLLAWFRHEGRFVATCFVSIDATPPDDTFAGDVSGGCVFPRLLLGAHESGGVCGLLGVVVYT